MESKFIAYYIYSFFVRSYDFDNRNYMARLRSRNRRCFCHNICSKKLKNQFDRNIYISREYNSLENHTQNALDILYSLGREEVPVYPGCFTNSKGEIELAEDFHG